MQEFQQENLIRNNIFQFCKPFVAKIEDALNEITQIKQIISDIKTKCVGTDDNIAQLEHLMQDIMFIRNQKDIIVENIGQKCIKIEDYCTSSISKNLSDILSIKLDFQNLQLAQADQNEYIGGLQNLSRGMTERIEMQNNSTLKMINKLQSDTQEFRIQQQQENEQIQSLISKNTMEIYQQQQQMKQVLQLSEQILEFKHQADSKIVWIEGSQKEIVQSYQQFMSRTEFRYEMNQLENLIKLLQQQMENEQETQQSQPQIKIHNLLPATPMFQQITQVNQASNEIKQKELDKITQDLDKRLLGLKNELSFIINQDQKKLDSDVKQISKQIELIQLKIKDQTQYCRTGFEKSKTNSSDIQTLKNQYQQQITTMKQELQNALEQQLLQYIENHIQKSLSSTMKASFSVQNPQKFELFDQTKSEDQLIECNYLEQQIIQSDVLIKYIKGICQEIKTNQPQTTDFEIQESDCSSKVDQITNQPSRKTNDKDMYKMHAEIVKIKSDIQNHQEYFQSQIKQLFKYRSLQDDTIQRLSKKTMHQQEQLNVSLAILLQNEMSLYQYPTSKLKNQELGFELDFEPNLQDDIIFGGSKLGKIEIIHRVLKLSSTNKFKKQQKDDSEEIKKQASFKLYENQFNQLQQLQPPQRSRKKMSIHNAPKSKRNNFSIDLQQLPNQEGDKMPPSLQDKIDLVNQSLDFSYRKLPYSTRQQVLIKYKKLN